MSKQKDFKRDNPALAFITAQPVHDELPTHVVQQAQHVQRKKEIREARVNLLLTPSLHANIVRIAQMERTSVNGLINKVLAEYEQQNLVAIENYKKIWEKEK